MKKLGTLALLLCFILTLCFGSLTLSYARQGLTIWFEKLVPSMFVSMVLVRILYHRHAFSLLRFPFLTRLLGIDSETFSLILCTMFLGFPSGSLLIDEALAAHRLKEVQAQRLLYTCSFATPGFVIMTCGVVLSHSVKIGMLLYVTQLLSGLILLFFTRRQAIEMRSSISSTKPFMRELSTAVLDSGKALYMIGGYLMLCLSVTGVLLSFLPGFLAQPLQISMEFSSGAVLIHKLAVSNLLKQLLLCLLLSFGGFCVHMQIFSMVEHTSLSYPVFLCFRLLQGCLSCLLFLLLYSVLM